MPFFDNYFYIYNVDEHRVEWYLKRHSFDHRICDDLCEVVLSYISIEDKHNLECVSKQFRSTIFERIHVLNASELKFDDKNDRNICHIFEEMIKKCRNITTIKTKFSQYSEYTYNPFYGYYSNAILNTIINYCTSLKSIEFGLYFVNNEMIERFGLRFGQFLKSIKSTQGLRSRESQYSDKLQHLLKYCPNLISLNTYLFQDFMNTESNLLLVPKLKKLNSCYGTKDIEAMVMFCDRYKNTIESLEIRIYSDVTLNAYKRLFQSLLGLNKLKNLAIDWMNDYIRKSDEDIKTYLSYFSQKCHKFKVNCNVAEDDLRENYSDYWSDDDGGGYES